MRPAADALQEAHARGGGRAAASSPWVQETGNGLFGSVTLNARREREGERGRGRKRERERKAILSFLKKASERMTDDNDVIIIIDCSGSGRWLKEGRRKEGRAREGEGRRGPDSLYFDFE